MRKTNYGTIAEGDELNENEKALEEIKYFASLTDTPVVEGETAISIPFVAKIMRELEREFMNVSYMFADSQKKYDACIEENQRLKGYINKLKGKMSDCLERNFESDEDVIAEVIDLIDDYYMGF